MSVLTIISIVLVLLTLYYWLTKNNNYWKNRNITFIPPNLLFGNTGETLLKKTPIGIIVNRLYNEYKDLPYLGLFHMRQPVLLIRDPSLIKQVLTTEFNKFHDNVFNMTEKTDPVLSKNPFFQKGENWKSSRTQLTSLLTNAKIKAIFPLMQEVCQDMVNYLNNEISSNRESLEAKELSLKFTSDNVANCAFGLKAHSFDNANSEIRQMIEDFLQMSTWATIKFYIIAQFPLLSKLLPIKTKQNEIADRFTHILNETIQYRKNNKIIRNDFLDSILELRSKSSLCEYTDDIMVGHAFTLFVEGTETSSAALGFALYEIAANLYVQNKLKTEIDETLMKYNNKFSFEAIQKMPYLDAVFLETLRKFPVASSMSRQCTENARLSTSDTDILIEKGLFIYLPVLAIHRDPQFYHNPKTFDPDRFASNAKYPFPKNCFFPFGDGPRICLGQKLANLQIKMALVSIVQNFEVRVNPKTKVPIELQENLFVIEAVGGLWLDFYKRSKTA